MKRQRRYLFILLLVCVMVPFNGHSESDLTKKRSALFRELQQIVYLRGDHLGYARKMIEYVRNKYKLDEQAPVKQFLLTNREDHWRRLRRNRDFDYYALLSGGLAIRESLQLDTISASGDRKGNVPVAGLTGPVVKSHPFKKMLQGRNYASYGLAELCPEDFYYIHFSNMGSALDLFDYMNQVGGAVYQRSDPKSVDFKVKRKVLTQLAIVENKKARAFYDHVIKEMAVVGSDPFLRLGSDVSFIYTLKSPSVFFYKINGFRDDFIKSHKAKTKKMNIAGKQTELLISSNRVVCSYLVKLDKKRVIISNSPTAITKIIDTYNKKGGSLAMTDDFKYMRSIYKAGDASEDAFLYLSDAFIRRLVGPRVRIKEARRLQEAMRIADLERLGLFYYQLYGKRARTLKDLEKEFGAEVSEHYAGLSFDERSFAVISNRFGKMGYFRSNIDEQLDVVSESEAKRYTRFVREYNNYWREYFDPIGIRIRQKDGHTRIETCILPLINNSIYNSLTQICGGKAVSLQTGSVPGEILKISTKLNENMLDRQLVNMLLTGTERGQGQLTLGQVFKNQITIGMLDARPMVDFDAAKLSRLFNRGRFRGDYMFLTVAFWSLFHPLSVSIPLEDTNLAEKIIDRLESNTFQLSRSIGNDFEVDRYYIGYKGKRINVTIFSFFDIIKFRLFSTIHNDRYIITTTDDYMYKLLDSKQKSDHLKLAGNVRALFMPEQISKEKNMYVLNMIESAREASLNNYGTYKLFSQLFEGKKNINELAYDSFGFELVCPSGGSYSIDKKSGQVINSVYGNGITRQVPVKKIMKGDVYRRFFSTEQIMLNLRFTPEGIMTVVDIK